MATPRKSTEAFREPAELLGLDPDRIKGKR